MIRRGLYTRHPEYRADIRAHIQHLKLFHPNIYPIHELLEYMEKPVLQNQMSLLNRAPVLGPPASPQHGVTVAATLTACPAGRQRAWDSGVACRL